MPGSDFCEGSNVLNLDEDFCAFLRANQCMKKLQDQSRSLFGTDFISIVLIKVDGGMSLPV